jgi:hypothetical protein
MSQTTEWVWAIMLDNCDVRYGSKADMAASICDVRFTPKADIPQRRLDVGFVPKVDIEETSKSACGKRPAGLSLSCRLAKCRHSIRSFDVDVPDEIANYFYRRGIRKFNANELVFDHYHQLELIEPVNAKIVTKMRFICDLIRVNTEILGNKPT